MKSIKPIVTTVAGSIVTLALGVTASQAALTAGDVAVIGRINNGSPDSFAIVNLTALSAGETIYFTDNGWNSSTALFRSPAGNDGDGNENLIKFTANNPITAGTVIRTSDSGADFTWTKTGSVPGGASGAFADLSLGQGGEQIYAFQGPANLPLQNPSGHLFLLDDTNAFENATDSSTGNVTPGLTAGADALSFNFGASNFIAFNTNSLTSGTKEDWLGAIANSANWTTAASGTLPSGSINVVPEPASLLLMTLGSLMIFQRRRQRLG